MTEQKRCKAKNRAGEPCGRPPIVGGTVCASHGGSAPAVRKAAERRVALARATAEVEAHATARGPLTVAEVYQEMLVTAGSVVAWRDVLQERVSARSEYGSRNALGTEQVEIDVALYERALDRTMRTLELIARLDLDTRLLNIGNAMGAEVIRIFTAGLDSLDLTYEQRETAKLVIVEELRRSEAPS